MVRLRNERLWLNLILVLAGAAFVIGISAPMLTLTQIVFVSNTFSLLSGALELVREGRYGLFLIIVGFSIVLPMVKLGVLARAANSPHCTQEHRRLLRWVHALGKWSMLDVFVVAVLIASVKLGSLASIELHFGLYCFAAAVLLIMLATQLLQWHDAPE